MKGIRWALLIFLLLLLADFSSTLINSGLAQYLETNPLYPYLGFAGLFVLNLGVAAVFYYGYLYSSSPNIRHALLYAFILVSVMRVFVVYNNIQVYNNPVPLEVAQAIPQAAKTASYLKTVVAPMALLFVPAWLSFYLFTKDYHTEAKWD